MIKYNNSNINDWYFDTSNIIKVYRNNAVCYYKVTSGDTPTPVQEPCFAVVDDITQYSDTEFEDVFNKADDKWYKLNNLSQYEQYGIYGSGRTSCEGSTSRLPDGYTEVEYIENTSTSYINTDLQIYSSTTNSFEVEAKLIAAKHDSQAYQNVFSCMSEDGEPYQGFTYRYQSSSLVGTSIPNRQNTFTIVNNADSTQTVTVTSSASQRTYTHTYPLTLFCGLNSSRSPFRWTNSKFYYCKIKMNDELVRDFVPCKRDIDNKYGMYDLVTNTFYLSPNNVDFSGGEPITPTDCVTTYNGKLTIDDGYEYLYSGGSWVNVGEVSGQTEYPLEYVVREDPPDNVTFTSMTEAEDYECPWVGMRATIDGDKYVFSGDSQSGYEWVYNPSRLPVGYTEVEYVQNTGTSYFNTNFTPNQDTRVVCDMQLVTASNYPRLWGAGAWNSATGILLNYENGYLQVSWLGKTSWTRYTSVPQSFDRKVYDVNKNYLYVDSVQIGSNTYTTRTASDPIGVFTYIGSGRPSSSSYWGQEHFKGKMYSFQIYDNGTLVRDLVPCIRDNDNTVGAYDIVNDVFYTVPTGYTTDKLVAGQPV